jgi:uncharacterized membrane protein SpoIIM required for sporulation
VISTQSTTVRAANLLASFIVIPIALLIQGESAMMFWGTNDVLWLAVFGVAIMSALIIRLGIVHFKRESLLGREIDMLNWKWVWQTFSKAFSTSGEKSELIHRLASMIRRQDTTDTEQPRLRQAAWLDFNRLLRWYWDDIIPALKRLAPAFAITLVIGVAAILAAYYFVDANIKIAAFSEENLRDALKTIRELILQDGANKVSAGMLFWHNLRAELLILLLGIFSFGVLSVLIFIGNFALIGAVLGSLPSLGLSPALVFISGILPHGIVELPSIILISAAALHMGLRLVTPDEGRTIGETMIVTFADVLKVLVAVCIPLLIVAALIEANITPQILFAAIGHALEIQP